MRSAFQNRHIGPNDQEINEMLNTIGVASVDELIDKTVPAHIRLKKELDLSPALAETEYLKMLESKAEKNQLFDNYIGHGYYGTHTPSVILRNVLENPGWYTAYTPYQAEIAQGRLEALLNFQTVVSDLTGMEIANASLLDEATAASEAMIMFFNVRSRAQQKSGVKKFFVSEDVFPQTLAVIRAKAEPLGIELDIASEDNIEINEEYFGALVQYPNKFGEIKNLTSLVNKCKENEVKVAVGADLLSLCVIEEPGKWGVDVVYGNSQRFGVPMGYGGPHAAFFATKEEYKRNIPGRIIGVSQDSRGKSGLRMALQTREQHIRRDKATSNICTAQALLAVMASMYAVYHGPKGLREIAEHTHAKANKVFSALTSLGFKAVHSNFFDTVSFETNNIDIKSELLSYEINVHETGGYFSISVDETHTDEHIDKLISALETITDKKVGSGEKGATHLNRQSDYLTHETFNSYHSETEMMRYLKRLENKDLSLVHSMIALGSCTMKLNAASQLIPLSWPKFGGLHPFVPVGQAQGYQEILSELDADLSEITGFAKVSLQPNSGAQGEYAGLMVIREYHKSRGDHQRNIVLIPSSAHGTNPASAVMAGMKVVVTKCDDNGNIDISDLREKAEKHSNELAGLMVTYPSTHGVFETGIVEINNIIHEHGGQVYMDGANMNAQVGLTNPGNINADVCHLNLHKTFAIPHGGGGPGMGPIGVASHLVDFLPKNPFVETGGENGIEAISAAPYGSSLILLISYGYIKMLGPKGLKKSTETAILNANYMKARLEKHYPVLYSGENGNCAHEMILDCRQFKKEAKVEVEDIAKRLMDYGFHAPTVSFPVAGTVMVEPTESEGKAELDRFCDSMISIKKEIDEIANGSQPEEGNVLKSAPHTADMLLISDWNKSYSREKAAYPLTHVRESKFWPSVGRVDNAHGDRNLICSCPSIQAYEMLSEEV
jgi:glycine dehydrogenase